MMKKESPLASSTPVPITAILESVITCPHCGYVKQETMPVDACQWFYECTNCHALLRPKAGDCCVFCSYGSLPCPPIQIHRKADGACCTHT